MNPPAAAAFHRYSPAAWLRARGADAGEFLQGQFSQDIRPAREGSVVYGLWLDNKGKVLADSYLGIGSASDEYWIASVASPGAAIRRRLEEFIIADDVVIEDGPPGAAVALLGEGGGAWLASAPRPGVYFRGRRTLAENWEWIFPQSAGDEVTAALGGMPELVAADLERLRIRDGLPAVPADLGPGDLPNEGGLEAEAISYTKGCYVGQEVMARLKSKGRIRRQLRRVAGSGPVPAVPAELWQEAARVGELRSAVADAAGGGYAGLALVSLAGIRPDLPLALGRGGPAVRQLP